MRPTRLAASKPFFLYLQCPDHDDNSSDSKYVFFLYDAMF